MVAAAEGERGARPMLIAAARVRVVVWTDLGLQVSEWEAFVTDPRRRVAGEVFGQLLVEQCPWRDRELFLFPVAPLPLERSTLCGIQNQNIL